MPRSNNFFIVDLLPYKDNVYYLSQISFKQYEPSIFRKYKEQCIFCVCIVTAITTNEIGYFVFRETVY